MAQAFSIEDYGITVKSVHRNPSVAELYEHALSQEAGTMLSSTGALVAYSGEKTGRSPKDKRIVDEPESRDDVDWGDINMPVDETTFMINRERAVDYLNTRERLYVIDGFAGWDEKHRVKVRIICARAYHGLFMHNMLIRPTREQLDSFGEPDYVVFNGGGFPANRYTSGMTSKTSVSVSFKRGEFVILGTEYAGEMKKGVFTIMNYLLPKRGHLSMHCSATEGKGGDTSVLFGLSGTGKTTLSADPKRKLVGDDEHCWTENGIFNIEGGCYAKAIGLSEEAEPEIFRAIRFGSVLENVVLNDDRSVDYDDVSITQNTRCSYPIEYIPTAKVPCVGGHPSNVIFLAFDAFGVLPPVSKLTPDQAMYHFISGYTAKVAGTEMGVKEPQATFSPCFGGPFMVWHPMKYAELLAEKLKQHNATAWLINTGYVGGGYGEGDRISLKHTRAIVDAIHSGDLAKLPTKREGVFGLERPTKCPEVPGEILDPRAGWSDKAAFETAEKTLAQLFIDNFKQYADRAPGAVRDAGPSL